MFFHVAIVDHEIIIRGHDPTDGTIIALHLEAYMGRDGSLYTLRNQVRNFMERFKPVKISRLEFLIATGSSH